MNSRPKVYYSHSYMWSPDDYLARGATGHVYMGYDKRSGVKVAVKMFTNRSEFGAMHREIGAIRQLPQHENIVQFLNVEEQEKTEGTPIIVMELCNAGSLYEVIDSPENAYGLDEEQFKLVILHVSRGLSHLKKNGFAHRDIKPGNILRVKDVDGKYTFKLTDFGTARKLGPDERFTSLHGTEEYLYPAMYERALVNPRAGTQFRDKVDLWSVGATFFHVATGRLPFQPYLKRQDNLTMHKIITEKPSGMILGWQSEQRGRIFYSESLPVDVNISNGLKAVITPVLAGLLENNFEKMWEFHHFFSYIEMINSMRVFDVFCVSKCTLHKVYLKRDGQDLMAAFKEAISLQTSLSPIHMEFYHDNLPLRTPVKPGQRFRIPATTPDSPITVFGGPPQHANVLETPALHNPPSPPKDGSISLTDDLRYAKDSCKVCWSYMHSAQYLGRTYKLMCQAANCLCQTIQQEHSTLVEKGDRVTALFEVCMNQLDAQINLLESEIAALKVTTSSNMSDFENEMQQFAREVASKKQQLHNLAAEKRQILDFGSFNHQVHGMLDGGTCCSSLETSVFDDGLKKMRNYVEEVEGLFKKLQDEKKNKISSQDTFNKRVNDFRRKDIQQRMNKAMKEVDSMVIERGKVYGKLYEFLAKCISLREEMGQALESLNSSVVKLERTIKSLQEWNANHQQSMQSVYQKLSVVSKAGMYNQQSSSTSIPPKLSSLLINLSSSFGDNKVLVEKQKAFLDRAIKEF